MSVSWGVVVHLALQLVRFLVACLVGVVFIQPQAMATSFTSLPAPGWITDQRQTSKDGYSRLEWAAPEGTQSSLFRLTEQRDGQENVSFIEGLGITVFRIEPGNYLFRLQTCSKMTDQVPVCGPKSRPLSLRVTREVDQQTGSLPLVSPGAKADLQVNDVGGPGELRPGLWFNPARSGHGWSFYWSNRLALPESHALHGNEYDLLGVWYTYEAKSRRRDDSLVCKLDGFSDSCPWIYEGYSPFVARLRMVQTGPKSFSGGVFVTRSGQEVQAGSASVTFGADSENAVISWNVDFKLQHLSGVDSITNLVGSQQGAEFNFSHYSGLWERAGDSRYTVVDNIGSFSEALEVLYADSMGDPAWIQAANAWVPSGELTDLCFYRVAEGFSPGTTGSLRIENSGCDSTLPAGPENRNATRSFDGFEEGRFWIELDLPSGPVSLGSAVNPAGLQKVASFHRIYFEDTDSACVISDISDKCRVLLSWFTDGNYPLASAFVLNRSTGQRRLLKTSTAPAMLNQEVLLDQPGSHVFELRMGVSGSSALIAQSTLLEVHDGQVPGPHTLDAVWLDQSEAAFRVQWRHDAIHLVDWFELEELNSTGDRLSYRIEPAAGLSKEFNYQAGPYGQYLYRIRACSGGVAGERCSAWSDELAWTVHDPDSEGGQLVHPWGDNAAASGKLATGRSFHYAMGYHFRPEVDGVAHELGGLFDGSKWVKLFARDSGKLLAQARVSAANSWSYTAISPVALSAGEEYTVCVYLDGSGGSYYAAAALPDTFAGITVLGSTYISTAGDRGAIPVNLTLTRMYGQADIGFRADQHDPEQKSANPDIPPAPEENPGFVFDAESASVGSTSGSFSVDARGAANYSIPIIVAPGSGGLAPALSLDYNSQSPNDIVGVGWSLGGLSTISRCTASTEQGVPGGSGGISFSYSDYFCLDGQRLVAISGGYGMNGTEYRTEVDAFLKIISFGEAGQGPAWFKVWHGDGSFSEYGNSADSRLEARLPDDGQTVVSWARNRFEDSRSNFIGFVYGKALSGPVEHFLERVVYTGNVRAGTAPYAEVRFQYEEGRRDLPLSYVGGAVFARQRILSRVDSLSKAYKRDSNLTYLRSYELLYENDGYGRKILESIKECSDPLKAICFPETDFSWIKNEHEIDNNGVASPGSLPDYLKSLGIADVNGDGRPDLLPVQQSKNSFFFTVSFAEEGGTFSRGSALYQIPGVEGENQPVRILTIDLNGDGLQDVIYPREVAGFVRWVGRLSDSGGFGEEVTLADDCCFLINPGTARIMDFDGDGLADLLTERIAEQSSGKADLVVLLNKRSKEGEMGFSPFRTLTLDYPRDLLPDGPTSGGWMARGGERLFTDLAHRSAVDAVPLDYNGDGKVDLVARINRTYEQCGTSCNKNATGFSRIQLGTVGLFAVFESDGTDRFVFRDVVARAAGSECSVPDVCARWERLPAIKQLTPVDINSDGLADLAFRDGSDGWSYQLNTGAGFTDQQPITRPPDEIRSKLAQLIDLNGDGYPEFIYPGLAGSNAANWVIHSNYSGSEFGASEISSIRYGNTGERDASVLLDFNGDGMLDNLFIDFDGERVSSSNSRLYQGQNLITGRSQEANNVISAIETATGARTELSYRPLTDKAVYTRMKDAAGAHWGNGSAVFDLLAPIYVVSRVATSAPTREDPSARKAVDYHYAGAKAQSGGRGFLGFGEVITWHPDSGIRTNNRYRQDFPFTGLMADSSTVLTSSASKFRAMSDPRAVSPPGWPGVTKDMPAPFDGQGETLLSYSVNQWQAVETVSGRATRWPSLIRTLDRKYTHRGTLEKLTLTNNRYRSYGRASESIVEIFAEESASGFSKVTTRNQYFDPDLSHWVLGRVEQITVVHERNGSPTITRTSGLEYAPASGLVIREITEPDNPQVSVITDHVLDDFGNRLRTVVSGAGMAARRNETVYDPLGRFSVRVINHFGQATSSVDKWNVFGLALEGRNIDNVLTQVSADPMGHVFSTWTATGSWEHSTMHWGRGAHCPESTSWHSASAGGGKPVQQTCYDLLGREIRVMTGGFDDRAVYLDSYYDRAGRATRVSEPYFAGDSIYWNVSDYDFLGRVKRITSAAGDRQNYGYSEDAGGHCSVSGPRLVKASNGLGQVQLEVRNVLGETVAVYDHDCGRASYRYDAIGNLLSVTGADHAVVQMFYDFQGRKTAVRDPDKGYWQYKWNALGELVRQLDAKGQAIDFEYDSMGRVIGRWELSGLTSLQDDSFVVEQHEATFWQNSIAGQDKGKSQPVSVIYQDVGASETLQRIDNSYDEFGRLVRSVSEQSGMLLAEETTYDNFGRVFQKFDASGDYRGIKYHYKTNGYLSKLIESRDGDSGVVYKETGSVDARGNTSYMRLGNGVEVFASHDAASGQLERLEAYDRNGAELQEVDYIFDALGNLRSRHDRSSGRDLTESFTYDLLNRLQRVELLAPLDGISTPLETLALNYSSAGNITWKSDVGNYLYGSGSAGPHAVTYAGGDTYQYDANGNQVSGNGRTIEYSVFDKAVRVVKDGQVTRFSYGAGNQRISRSDQNAAGETRTTHYAGSVELIETQGSSFFRRHIADVAVSDFYPETGTSSTRYQVRDHLGSIHNLTDGSGEAGSAVWMNHAAFGQRRANNWRSPLSPELAALLGELTTRGFTGHEHVDGLGFIHMNGRIYDPKLGRFLQADPFVQAPKNTQNLNRYSYALNNPLSLTDPSGYFFKRFLKRWGPLIAAIALSVLLPGPQGLLATHLGLSNIYGQAAITGFIAGAITSGTLKGAVIGSITAVAIAGVVQAFSTAKTGSALAPPENMMPEISDIERLFGPGGPPAGLYRLEVEPGGYIGSFSSTSVNDVVNGDVIFTNGIKNGFREAIKNGTSHLHQAGLLKQSYILNFNPTNGFFPDLLEASKDIVGAHTGWTQSSLARNLANTIHRVSENGINGIQLVGHSQGGAITASALRYASKAGMNLSGLSGGGVSLHGAPVNAWLARTRIARQSGVGIVSRAQFGDAVHVLGGLNISNPLEVPIALLRFPALFSHDPGLSPHSLPCGGAKFVICGR